MTNLDRRLRKLERGNGDFDDVLRLINGKTKYSELTDEQKDRYYLYHGTERKVVENVIKALREAQGEEYVEEDFILKRKPKPPTETELKQRIEEVREFFEETQRKYNAKGEI